MLRTPFIETLSDLFIRSSQWRGREELFVDEQDRITGHEAFDQSLKLSVAGLQKIVDDVQAAQKKTAEDLKKKADAPVPKDAPAAK